MRTSSSGNISPYNSSNTSAVVSVLQYISFNKYETGGEGRHAEERHTHFLYPTNLFKFEPINYFLFLPRLPPIHPPSSYSTLTSSFLKYCAFVLSSTHQRMHPLFHRITLDLKSTLTRTQELTSSVIFLHAFYDRNSCILCSAMN
jgi:hypothetical protein